MTCAICRAPMIERSTSVSSPYRYTLAGLPHIGLVGIVVFECPNGHPSIPRIPRIGELHRVIAEAFIEKSEPLIGSELRFLRKNAGISAQKFAALLRVDPAHLSRVENDKTAMGSSVDRLARAIVVAAKDGKVREILLNEAAERLAKKKRHQQLPLFRLEHNRWKEAA
jgi:transcriptional regulator with XRE-family HTH domain